MSGLAGICSVEAQSAHPDYLSTMMKSLAHRGPDDQGVWSGRNAALGHLMLWTTPESLCEKLPFESTTGELVITADARIDNREELLQALDLPGPLAKVTDSQLILAAFEKWRDRCPEYLVGAFAFAIWDQKSQTLFCARDHLGVKPFYYYQSAQGFLFASEIKALLALPQVPRQVNETRIADYLSMMMEDKSITTYQDIFRLPPGHCLQLSPVETQIWCYWSLQPTSPLTLDSDEAYAQEFKRLFTEAVRCRLRSAFTLGSQLSGGLDSSSVTCTAQQLLAQTGRSSLHTVSNIFDDVPECDERPYINAVLQTSDYTSHFVHADQSSPLADLDHIWQFEDEAFIGPNHFLPWQLNRKAQEVGIRVFLDGFDGDTTVSHGVLRLKELASAGEWNCFGREAKELAQRFGCTPQHLLHEYGLPTLLELAQHFRWFAFMQAVYQIHHHFQISYKYLCWHYGLKAWHPKYWYQRWRQSTPARCPSIIKPSFAEFIQLEKRLQTLSPASQTADTAQAEHWQSLTTGLLTFVLELLDRAAAAFSLEARHPFMDKRLIEFCLAVPAEQKFRQGWTRMILRQALADVLPDRIQWRGGKTSMTPNFLHGVLTADRKIFDEIVDHPPQEIERYIDVTILQNAYTRLISDQPVKNTDIMTVWRATILALWFRDNAAASSLKASKAD